MRIQSFLRYSIITALLALFFFQTVYSNDIGSDYSPDKISGFAKHLIRKKEYYRASVELDRLNSYYPDFLTPSVYNISRLYLYSRSLRHDLLLEFVKKEKPYDSGYIIAFDSAISMNRFETAAEFLEKFSDSTFYSANTASFAPLLNKRQFAFYLMEDRDVDALQIMKKAGSKEFRLYNELMNCYIESKEERKNQWIALGLGFVPGMGYLYAGSQMTGVVALTVTAISFVTSFFAFKTGNTATGLVVGSIGAFFYTGNILGGYLEARRYNRINSERLKSRLMSDLNMGRDIEMIYDRYGLGNEKK